MIKSAENPQMSGDILRKWVFFKLVPLTKMTMPTQNKNMSAKYIRTWLG